MLIVDDHAATRTQVRQFLASRGIEVCGESGDGQDAIDKVKKLKPSIVLLDIYMPHLNGIAVAHEIRKIAPSTKIIFLSNHEPPKSAATMRLFGGDAFVSKSAGILELATVLQSLLLVDTLPITKAPVPPERGQSGS